MSLELASTAFAEGQAMLDNTHARRLTRGERSLALLFAILVGRTHPWAVAAAAIVVFTFPAVIAMLFAPGIALILQNLS